MKKISIWSVILGLLLFVAGCSSDNCDNCNEDIEPGNIQVGDELPDFSVKLKSGEVINKKSLDGKVSLILFFSITCPDCQALFPSIERIYEEYKDNDKFVFLAISRAEGEDKVGPFMNEKGYTFPYSPQETRDVYSLFAPSIVPRVYISNDECIVEEIFIDNPLATYEEMKNKIDELMVILCCKS
jgi:Uncharacterized protein SCO1/SenC/PrrC, involved in biogenesis of respiratory and photosynthetic systems